MLAANGLPANRLCGSPELQERLPGLRGLCCFACGPDTCRTTPARCRWGLAYVAGPYPNVVPGLDNAQYPVFSPAAARDAEVGRLGWARQGWGSRQGAWSEGIQRQAGPGTIM